LRPLAYSQAHVLLIAFSISSPDSLQNITTKWYGNLSNCPHKLTYLLTLTRIRHPEVIERCPGVPIILVGLKKDLRDDPVAQEEMRKRSEKFLTADEGEDVRKRIGAKKYLECSSLTGEGVDDVFEAATRQSLLSGDHKKQSGCCVIL
jgi:Rho family protein